MYHAAAVVGLNTSALVESAIVDRPVFTVLLPEFRDNQEGTFHFHHLMRVGDGFLNVSRSLAEHAAQLGAVLNGAPGRPNRPFVEAFIRPRGADVAATPVFVEALETMAAAPPLRPQPVPAWVARASSGGLGPDARRPPAAGGTALLEPGEAARVGRQCRGDLTEAGRSARPSVSTRRRA